jgi:hypothetical protein
MGTLFFFESFDWCSNAQLKRGPFNLASSSGRVTGRTGSGWGQQINASLLGPAGTGYLQWTCGMSVSDATTNETYMAFICNTTFGHPTFKLIGVGDGTMYVDAFLAGTDVTSTPSTFIFHSDTSYYIETQCQATLINVNEPPTPPYYYVKYLYQVVVNGSTTILSGEVDTVHWNGAAPDANFRQLQIGGDFTIDDVYLTDNEFLGDISVQTLFPNADATYTQWTPSGGTANYPMVDEHDPGMDDNTTYVTAASADLIDTYRFDPLTPFTPPMGSSGIKGVQLMMAASKVDSGDALLADAWGTKPIQTTSFVPSDAGYTCQWFPERYSVFTEGEWSQTEVNTIQAGQIRTL